MDRQGAQGKRLLAWCFSRQTSAVRLLLLVLLFLMGGMVNGAWATDYTFHVIALDGTEVLQRTISESGTPTIASKFVYRTNNQMLKSPLIEDNNYKFWDKNPNTNNDAVQLTNFASDKTDIYVTYTYYANYSGTFDLNGEYTYAFWNNNCYDYDNNGSLARTTTSSFSYFYETYLWTFEGNDPYKVKIKNRVSGKYLSLNATGDNQVTESDTECWFSIGQGNGSNYSFRTINNDYYPCNGTTGNAKIDNGSTIQVKKAPIKKYSMVNSATNAVTFTLDLAVNLTDNNTIALPSVLERGYTTINGYYTDDKCTETATSWTDDMETVYIKYTVSNDFPLNTTNYYAIYNNSTYVFGATNSTTVKVSNNGDKSLTENKWKFESADPYRIVIKNAKYGTYLYVPTISNGTKPTLNSSIDKGAIWGMYKYNSSHYLCMYESTSTNSSMGASSAESTSGLVFLNQSPQVQRKRDNGCLFGFEVVTTPQETVTYHIVSSTTPSVDVLTISAGSLDLGTSLTTNFDTNYRANVTRLGAILGTTFYKSDGTAITEVTGGVTDYYLRYTIDDAVLSSHDITFSTDFATATWMNIKYPARANTQWIGAKEGSPVYVVRQTANAAPDTYAYFAFIGDPYHFRIVNLAMGDTYDLQKGESYASGNWITFQTGSDNKVWALHNPNNSTYQDSRFQIIDMTSTSSTPFHWDWYGDNCWGQNSALGNSDDLIVQDAPQLYTFSLTTHIGATTLTYQVGANSTDRISVPAALQRKYISSYSCTYKDGSGTSHSINLSQDTYGDLPNGITTIYVDYVVNTEALPFTVSTSYADAHWYNIKQNGRWGYNQMKENASYKCIKLKADSDIATETLADDVGLFAFFGDPYEMKVVNKYSGGMYYLGVPAGTISNTNVFYSDAINSSGIYTWEMVDGTNYATGEFVLRQFGTYNNPWYFRSEWNSAISQYRNGYENNECRWAVAEPPHSITVKYEVYDAEGVKVAESSRIHFEGDTPDLPDGAVRMACNYTYHSGSTSGSVISTITEDTETIYVTYTVDTSALPFTFSTDYATATWYNMQIPSYGTTKWIYSNGNNESTKTDVSDLTAPTTYYAFLGDPYRLRVVNMSRGSMREAQAGGTDAYSRLVQFLPGSSEGQWGLVDPVTAGTGRFQIIYVPSADLDYACYWSGSTGNLNMTNTRGTGAHDDISTKSATDDFFVQPVTNTYYSLTYKVYDSNKALAATLSTYYESGSAITVELPDAIKRAYCDYTVLYDTFDGNTFSNSGAALPTTMPSSHLTYYVQYTLNDAGSYLFGGSSNSPNWFRLKNSSGNYMNADSGGTLDTPAAAVDSENSTQFEWAFIGTPYDFQIINRASGTSKFAQPAANSNNSTISMSTEGSATLSHWEAILPSQTATHETAIILKDSYYNSNRSYVNSAGILSVDGTQRPNYDFTTSFPKNYTFHIVDRSGHKAIKAEGSWYVGDALSYEAIPEVIRSPYIADETLTFYTTATEAGSGDSNDKRKTYTLSNAITAPTASTTDIYVNYTIDHLSEKQLDFSGTRQYYIQAYDDKFITKLDLNNGSNWASEYYHGSLLTEEQIAYHGNNDNAFWSLIGNDPYNIRIKGHAFWWFSQNDKGYVLRFQNVDNNYPNIGVILMPDANDASAFKLLSARYDTDDRWYFRRQSGSSNDVADWVYTGTTNDEQCIFRFYPVVHYRVFNQSGTEAIDWRGPSTFTADGTQVTVGLPAGVRSPLIPAEDFTLRTTSKDGEAITAPISRSISDVFVTYTTENMASYVNLAGGSHYNIKQPANADASSYYYWYRYESDHGRINVNNSTTASNKNESKYRWELRGGDPYAVEMRNWENTAYQVTSDFGNAHGAIYSDETVRKWSRFLLLGQQGEADNSGKYRMMVSMTRENELNMNSYDWTLSWRKESSTPDDILHPNNFYIPYQTVVEFEADLTYHLINLSGKEALTYVPQSTDESKTNVVLPDEFKSPLAKEYKYYTSNQMNYDSSTGAYSVKAEATSMTESDDMPSGISDIFVTYEYDSDAGIDLSGTQSVTLHGKKTGHIFEMCVDNAGKLRSRSAITQKKMWYEWWPNGTKITDGVFDPYEVTFKAHRVDQKDGYTELGAYPQTTTNVESANLKAYNGDRTCTTWMILNKDASGSVSLMVNRYPSVSHGSSANSYQYLCENESNAEDALQTKWYSGTEEDARFVLQPIYTYHVVNLSGKEVIKAIEGRLLTDADHKPAIPQRIYSPMVKNYHFYDKSSVTSAGGTVTLNVNAEELQDVRNATDRDIYVFYRPADIDNSVFDITGQVSYNMYTENQSLYAYDGSNDDVKSKTSPTDEEKLSKSYLWILKGNDPYNVQIYNANDTRANQPIGHYQVSASDLGQPKSNWSNPAYFDLSKGKGNSSLGSVTSYCLVWGTSTTRGNSQIQLLAESLSDIHDWYLSNVQSSGFKMCWYFNTMGGSTGKTDTGSIINLIRSDNNSELTYVIVNKKGQAALSVKDDVAMGVAPSLPVALRSPFAKNYTYHSTQENSSDNLVTTTTADAIIYVYYDLDETNTALGINGDGYYYMKVNGSYAYADSEADTGKTADEKATDSSDVPYYVWAIEANDDPYDITLLQPGNDDKSLGMTGYERPAAARRRVPAENSYPLEIVDGSSTTAMHFALLNGNELSGHYALAVTLGSAGSNGSTLPEAALYGDQLDYVGSQTANTLTLLQRSIDNVDDAVQVEFEPYTVHYTYHIVDPEPDGNAEHVILESYTYQDEIPAGALASDHFPDALVRLGVPVDLNGYYTDAGTWPGENDLRLGFDSDIYVSYEVDESLLPFRYSNASNDVSQMYWNNWYGNGETNAKKLSSSDIVAGTQADDIDEDARFAFFGDPYRTQIINCSAGKNTLMTVGGKDTWGLVSFSRDQVSGELTPQTQMGDGDWLWLRVFGTSSNAKPTYLKGDNGTSPAVLSSDYDDTAANWEQPLRHKFKAWGAKYSIVDLSNTIAATATSRSPYIEVPADILSPALDGSKVNYSYTKDRSTAKSLVDITREPYSFETIYVFYTKDDIQDVTYTIDGQEKVLKIDNTKKYNFLVDDGSYVNVSGSSIVATTQSDTQRSDAYLWTLDARYDMGGETGKVVDPYQLTIVNADGTTSVSKYVLLSGSDNSHYTLLQSSPTADGTTSNPHLYYTTALSAQDATPAQVQFKGIPVTVTYKVVNLENRVAIMYTVDASTKQAEGGDAPVIPDAIKSSLVEESGGAFSYHTATDANTSSDLWRKTYTQGAEITELDYTDNQIVYVYYTYNPSNSTIDLNGGVKYNISNGANYIYYGNSSTSWYPNTKNDVRRTTSKPDDTTLKSSYYQWRIKGNDPYNVQLQNMGLTYGYDNNYGRWNGTTEINKDGYTTEWYIEPVNSIGSNNQNARLGTAYDCHFVLLPSTTAEGDVPKVDFIVSYASRVRATNASSMGTESYYTDPSKQNTYIYLNLAVNETVFRTNAESLVTLTPNVTLPVTFHLTHKVTNRENTKKDDGVVVLSKLAPPTGWERKYCTYTYTYYYRDGEDGEGNAARLPLSADEYDAGNDTHHKVDDATVLPALYIADNDVDTRVHIYINYTAAMPFNVLANTQSQIEALATGTEALKTFFDLTTYEKRVETLGSVVTNVLANGTAEEKANMQDYLHDYTDLENNTARLAMRRCDFVYFMVMDTNDDYSSGNQYFLRHDNGSVDWLNNDFKLHVAAKDNYKQWDYSRSAEAYREDDHDPFQEKRWLWAFAGDPYDLFIFNLSGALDEQWNELMDGVTATYHLDHLVNYSTQRDKLGTVTGYAPKVPAYDDVLTWSDHYAWGLADSKGSGSDDSFSLMAAHFDNSGNFTPSLTGQPLYWRMANGKTVSLQERADNFTGLDYNIKVLPYEPKKYEYLRLVVRRDDNVADYMNWLKTSGEGGTSEEHPITYYRNLPEGAGAATVQKHMQKIDDFKTGTVRMYTADNERQYVAGDVIKVEDLPIELRRAFCDYTLYDDDYFNAGDFTVKYGSDRGTVQTYADDVVVNEVTIHKKGDVIYNDQGAAMYNFYAVNPETGDPIYVQTGVDGEDNPIYALDAQGNKIRQGAPPQTIYVEYEVTSDIFLKQRPTKAQVAEMKANNDHLFFMDFPNPKMLNGKLEAYNTGHHAYFDETATFRDQIGTLYDGEVEKMKWDSGTKKFVGDEDKVYNDCQYKTTTNRMETVPEDLKWYFVGDPYAVQVYNTNSQFETDAADCTNAANLARIDPTESRFQFVVDCVHLRIPDASIIDERESIEYTDENGEVLGSVDNSNYGNPYFNDFYWEMVESPTGVTNGFALRFRANNQVMGYRNVYYYLAHDGLSREYRQANDEKRKGRYNINLNYRTDNRIHLSGKYLGYHEANNDTTVIRLIQPAKVYFSAYKDADGTHSTSSFTDANLKVKEELSEYFGVGETITEVPRHLQRKYAKYCKLGYQNNNNATWYDATFPVTLSSSKGDNAYNMETCSTHTVANDKAFVNGALTRASYKFRVLYDVDDVTNPTETDVSKQIHLFTPAANPSSPTDAEISNPQWLDLTIAGTNWLYYDKMNRNEDGTENQTTLVSNYRRAMSENKSGWNSNVSGWTDGLKGLHWAFIGDPYDFTILNRRRYEDGTNGTDPMWLTMTKTTIPDYQGTVPNDSVVWTTGLAASTTATNTSTATAATADAGTNSHFSLQMWKVGGDSDFFLRTASLKQSSPDDGEGGLVGDYSNDQTSPGINQTNNYWRMVAKAYPNNTSATSFFEMVPYSLSDKSTYNSTETSANYSQTMSGLGVTQQRIEIRTAVAKDEDGADNDCFDANIKIYNTNGELKAQMNNVEVTYGDVIANMPQTLKRYGCSYTCYLNYGTGSPTEIATFREASDPTEVAERDALQAALSAATKENPAEIAYVYEVTDDIASYFTSLEDAAQDDYVWSNAYYKWNESYSGTNVRIVYYVDVFDHYVYSADGHIIDEVYRTEERVRYGTGTTTTTAYGWVNSHTDDSPQQAYGDVRSQNVEDSLKWAFVGDPYDFQLKNYAKYLLNDESSLYTTGTDAGINFSTTGNSHWALALSTDPQTDSSGNTVTDSEGNTLYQYYLALIDDDPTSATYGQALRYVTFDRAQNGQDLQPYEQYLKQQGGPLAADPRGMLLNNSGIKAFYITDLASYANMVVYHLVIAHQHSRDPEDIASLQANNRYDKKVWTTINDGFYHADASYNVLDHLAEWDWYHNHSSEDRNDYPLTSLGSNYVKPSSLRDVITDPIPDYTVQRVGIGNRLSVPWYMERQFCTYDLYQRDVLRSETDYSSPAYEEADGEWTGATATINGTAYKVVDSTTPYAVWNATVGEYLLQKTFVENGETKLAYNVKWESVTHDESARGYATILAQNGKKVTRLDDSHKNRMVIIDVVYHVNPKQFRFADKGRNTTAWYSMMTNNPKDGLMNFSYKDGIGARHGREEHYTNNYLWAPEGDPYGFVMHSRYATINGTGWDNVVVSTTGKLPTDGTTTTVSNADFTTSYAEGETRTTAATDVATYTGAVSDVRFIDKRIIHQGREDGQKTWSARNAVYEMFTGNDSYSFLMHPTSAYVDISGNKFSSFYMIHNTTTGSANYHKAELQYVDDVQGIRSNVDACWRLFTTPEQLLPYFERSGYVGGLKPTVANHFQNISLYNRLKEYKAAYQADPSVIDFSVIDQARELVYGGKFYKRGGSGNPYSEELLYTDPRPDGTTEEGAKAFPLKFVSTNLVPLQKGYYRIQAFSRKALDADGANLDNTGTRGIVGPRYISGYRFKSEMEKEGYNSSHTLQNGSRWLHFIETDEEHTTLATFNDLNTIISSLESGSSHYERNIEPHPAMRGNIPILPAEYDPSSIFYFEPADDATDPYDRYNISTQGLRLRGRAGGKQGTDVNYGITKLVDTAASDYTAGAGKLGTAFNEPTDSEYDNFDDYFRLNDIGGTAVTMRLRKYAIGDYLLDTDGNLTSTQLDSWDKIVAENLKTNYLCIDANHRYRITIHKDNEMKEIGDSYLDGAGYWQLADINYGIQDTKWMLQPVGVQTEWPYNEMPLRLEVNEGERTNAESESSATYNYYASLYVPFDTRLQSTLDNAFTATRAPNISSGSSSGTIRLGSVSQINNMGNGQFIPAGWPVVVRTNSPKTGAIMTWNTTSEEMEPTGSSRYYVNLYLPNDEPSTSLTYPGLLNGQYLDQELTDTGLQEKPSVKANSTDKRVMVFGLPFVEEGSNTTTEGAPAWYAYQDAGNTTTDGYVNKLGFYTNENWWRGRYDNTQVTEIANDGYVGTSFWATARNATVNQRNNKYVYHNKAYYIYTPAGGSSARPRIIALFGDEEDDVEEPQEEGEPADFTEDSGQPWPCDVYDLQGRRVARNETPETLRRNHPGLPKGIYIFRNKKVIVK